MTDSLSVPPPCFYRYWGKTKGKKEQPGDDYHLLIYHCLDVAACGYWLVKNQYFAAGTLFRRLGFSPEQGALFFAWLLALHDLGKFARGFQQLSVYAELVQPVSGRRYSCRHDSLGYWLWHKHLRPELKENRTTLFPPALEKDHHQVLDQLMELIMGHHGKPPKMKADGCLAFTDEDIQAVREWMTVLAELFAPVHLPEQSKNKTWRKTTLSSATWPLAGLTVLADWLGSSERWFPFRATPIPVARYWELALDQARQAVDQLPAAARCAEFSGIERLFPFISQPTPLQKKAAEITITTGAADLFILEDATGAGKTEAALILVNRLLAQGKGNGLYIGLPTMATANAMFDRLQHCYRALFSDECAPSLMLAHSASQLNPHFRQALWQPDTPSARPEYEPGEATALAGCHHWFADSRKKALLADTGVGTLDQALMAVLPYRHQSLRMLGLQGKILLLDEIHACDAWLNKLVEGLLEFHASQGGSAIILSATLSQKQRQDLVSAFARGQNHKDPLNLTRRPQYPWLTHYSATKLTEYPLKSEANVNRVVNIDWLHSEQEALQQIRKAVETGHCIAWIRNTVDEAIRVYQILAQEMDREQLILFHSRFAFCDRLDIENRVINCCGKNSSAAVRQGKVIIATQVIEQSLDLDFDCMLTDLAPIDLLIQRAGRLQRHIRDKAGNRLLSAAATDQRGKPLLQILAPEWQEHPDDNWLQPPLTGTGYVYPDHGRLWLGQKTLRKFGQIRIPEDARALMEEVYETTPEELTRSTENQQGKDHSARACAGQLLLNLASGYCDNVNDLWHEDIELTTRLGEAVIRLYLARRQAGEITPYATGPFAWEMSRLQIRQKKWHKIKDQIPHLPAEELKKRLAQHHLLSAEVIILPDDCDFYCSAKGLYL